MGTHGQGWSNSIIFLNRCPQSSKSNDPIACLHNLCDLTCNPLSHTDRMTHSQSSNEVKQSLMWASLLNHTSTTKKHVYVNMMTQDCWTLTILARSHIIVSQWERGLGWQILTFSPIKCYSKATELLLTPYKFLGMYPSLSPCLAHHHSFSFSSPLRRTIKLSPLLKFSSSVFWALQSNKAKTTPLLMIPSFSWTPEKRKTSFSFDNNRTHSECTLQ